MEKYTAITGIPGEWVKGVNIGGREMYDDHENG
jgi:hypothetical protein